MESSKQKATLLFFIVEPGYLEDQATLLLRSIQISDNKEFDVIVINPGRHPLQNSPLTALMQTMGVTLIEPKLNTNWSFYPLSNKVLSCAYIEEKYACKYKFLIFLDTDIVVSGNINAILNPDYEIAAKADDDLNDIIWLNDKKPNLFWELIRDGCRLKNEDIWSITSRTNKLPFKLFFNSGVIVKKASNQFFQFWLENFKRIMSDKRLFEIDYLHFFFLEQASFSLSVVKFFDKSAVNILDYEYNYPVHLLSEIGIDKRPVLIHYHDEFYETNWKSDHLSQFQMQKDLDELVPLKDKSTSITRRLSKILSFQKFKLQYKYEVLPKG